MKRIKKTKISSLYIHIPFCRHICPYCDFAKLIRNDVFEEQYINQLLKDLSSLEGKFFKFKTIYIGGGTPSSLKLSNLERILLIIQKIKFKNAEFTIEANPEDINKDFLELLKKYGVNRISIGVQTFDKNILKSIGRDYSIDFKELVNLVNKYVDNINFDFIYGLPNYNSEVLKKDLGTFFELNVNHASFYSLIVSPGTIYFNKGIKEIDDDQSREYYDYILKEMRNHGFERYEVSNYSKPGFECEHNLNYWKNGQYVAVGLGSSGYEGNIRYINTKNFSEYISGINNKEIERITSKSLKEYYFITNLRLKDGFKLSEYKKIFNEDFLDSYRESVNELVKNKLVEVNGNRFYCTDEGIALLDLVLEKFIF